MLKGFISYAREDAQDVSVDLERQLAELDNDGIARFWVDRQIRTGDEWESRLLHELNKAEVVVVIVTPRSMDRSSYVRTTELPLISFNLRRRDIIVIPALAKKVHWKIGPLAGLQACPTPPWIGDSLNQDARTSWAFAAADAIRKKLEAVELHANARQAINVASGDALRALDRFERALSTRKPKLKHRTAVGTVRLLEVMRFAIRAPAVDVLDDCPLAIGVAQKLHSAVVTQPDLEAAATNLILSLEVLLAAARELQFETGVDDNMMPPSTFLYWSNNLLQLSDIELAVQRLQSEINFIRQKRRSEERFSERNEIYSVIAEFAERKSALMVSELEDEKVDINLLASQSDQLAFGTQGFLGAMAASSGKAMQEIIESEKEFLEATRQLDVAIDKGRHAPAADNLKRIGAITLEIEQKLNALSVWRFSHIAQWTRGDVERIERELGITGRISRENWIEQAQILDRGGDTRFSREFDRRRQAPAEALPSRIKLADALRELESAKAVGQVGEPSRTDLASLRSVRSEAYQDTSEPGPEAARRVASMRKVRTSQADDLKRIKGIGVLIEKRLNALGVTTYEDIANWTSDDIERISKSFDFKNRIQRESWVEQARILAAGGDTEFSRRTDRETGRK